MSENTKSILLDKLKNEYNEYIKNQVVNYYEELIEETLEQISDNNYTFEIITDDDVLKKDVIIEESKDNIKVV